MPNRIDLNQIRQDQLNTFVNTRIESSTGTLFSQITGSALTSGFFDDRYINVTGNELVTGAKSFFSRPQVSGTGILLSGEPLSVGQTGLLASSGSLQATGQNLQTQINTIGGITGTYTGLFYPRTGNPSGFTQIKVTGSNALTIGNFTGVGSARVILSGSSILISGDPLGMGLFSTGVTSLAASGTINTGLFTGNLILSGGGNITVFTGANNTIHISGNTGAYANFLTLGATAGVVSFNTTGFFPSGRVSGNVVISGTDSTRVYTGENGTIIVSGIPIGLRSIAATGIINTGFFTGDVLLSGAGNITVLTGVRPLIVISGDTTSFVTTGQTGAFATSSNLTLTGANLQNQLNRITGSSCLFDSGIQTNTTRQTFLFPITFAQPPFVFTQLKYLGNTGTSSPTIAISGVTTTGFTGVYNTGFTTTGYALSIWATSGANAWSQSAGSSSTPSSLLDWWNNNPDRPPSAPSVWDDEFVITGTLPGGNGGKWNWINQGNATAIVTGDHLRLRDIGTSDSVSAIYQTISGTSTTGNPWAITAKLKLNDVTYQANNKCGLFISGTGSSRLACWGYRTANSSSASQTLYSGAYSTATSVTESTTTFMMYGKDLYLRVLNTGNAGVGLFFQYSRDGYSYRTVFSGVSNGFITEGIMNIGLFVDAVNSSATFIDIDYFRLATGIYF
jgi:hypothetical protein